MLTASRILKTLVRTLVLGGSLMACSAVDTSALYRQSQSYYSGYYSYLNDMREHGEEHGH